jgi:hypothetical protein
MGRFCSKGYVIMRQGLTTVGLAVLLSQVVRAQPMPAPSVNPPLADELLGGGYQIAPPALPDESSGLVLAPYPDPLGEPPWCASPYQNSAWRIGLDLIPTSSHVSEQAFGEWDDGSGLALRLNLGYEGREGVGTRLLFWGFGQEADTLVDDVELGASTFYWDFYKRFFIEQAELVLGAGAAGGALRYDLQAFNDDADFSGGGMSVFAEGFYPFVRLKKTDIGSVARARLALMSGRWDDDGMPFINDTDHDVLTVMELAWGLELRRRFGRLEEKYWYVAIVPEFQRWESSTLPDEFDPSFEGTNISFGLAW